MAYEWSKGDLEWEKPKVLPPVIKQGEHNSSCKQRDW